MSILVRSEKKRDYLYAVIGTMIMAMATNLFFDPAHMVPGGFTGLAMILQRVTTPWVEGGIPVWLGNILLNAPLIILAVKVRGWKFMRKTIFAALMYSIWLFIIPVYDLVPDNPFLTAVIGGMVMGAGVGYVFLGKATTGGTDTIAAVLQRFMPEWNAAQILPFLDGMVILLALGIFGIERTLYAVVCVVLMGRAAEWVIGGVRNDSKLAYIISEKHEQIAAAILHQVERGVTVLEGTGKYTESPRPVLFCAVSRKQTVILKEIVNEIDDHAFMILTDAKEIRGEGFMRYGTEEF